MDQQVAVTKKFFNSHNITLSDEWLESCIEWFQEQNPNSNYSKETLQRKVYEQWLLLDLRETELPILPPNLSQTQKIVLHGVFSLQMMYVVDISQPKLSQLQKIRNMVLNATDEEFSTNTSTGKRMLQLVLTDGVQEVEAVEYQPIPLLNINLPPGVKLKLCGPVTMRRGQLMLESNNVEILGGEVEELLVSNAHENILAKELNMPLNPHPILKLENPPVTITNTVAESTISHSNPKDQYICLNNTSNKQQPQSNTGVDPQNMLHQSRITSYISNSNQPIVKPSMSLAGCSNHNAINKLESRNDPNEKWTQYVGIKEEQMIIDECDNLLEIEKDMEIDHIHQVPAHTSKEINTKTNYFDNETDIDVFEGIDIDGHLDLIDKELANNSKVIPIGDLLCNNVKDGKFLIKAKFNSVSGKLSINNIQQWSLRIIIKDDSGEIESWVHSDVITSIINFSPATMQALKEEIRNKKEDATNLMMQKIKDLRTNIEELDCVMEIIFKSSEQYPTITSLK